MPLEPGRQLGPYQIEAPLGAGGMGEVYKATDTRLDRTVAIKVLPEHVAADPELKQRFEREARTVAALNHPHICTLYDIGREGETDFLVMEYLDGETVAQRLEKGALPLDQALQVAIAIADALDKAHRQGIVHRDLKPGNIMLTKAGAKLLDFGLAKLKPTEQAGGLSALPTQPANLTQEGAILGTFQYMAPEQLEGQEADARTDIFAFGAVVYEMVTGKKAFEGKSQASLIAAILERDPPPMSDLQAMSPALLDSVVKTCLAKDPEGRWQSAGDVGRQLEFIQGGSRPSVAARVVVAPEPVRSRRARGLAVTALVLGLAIGGVGVWSVMQPAPRSVARFAIPVKGLATSINAGINSPVALSPDGKTVAYLSVREGAQLYQRSLDQLEAVPIRGTEGCVLSIFFAGRRVGGVLERHWPSSSKDAHLRGTPVDPRSVDVSPEFYLGTQRHDHVRGLWYRSGPVGSRGVWRYATEDRHTRSRFRGASVRRPYIPTRWAGSALPHNVRVRAKQSDRRPLAGDRGAEGTAGRDDPARDHNGASNLRPCRFAVGRTV